jgi:hypothetical protein
LTRPPDPVPFPPNTIQMLRPLLLTLAAVAATLLGSCAAVGNAASTAIGATTNAAKIATSAVMRPVGSVVQSVVPR